MTWYIYEITNNINGKTYIGLHHLVPKDKYMGSGILIKKAISKYGKDNFRKVILVKNIPSLEEARAWEIYFIARNRQRNKAEYNIADGVKG
jgi:hypothetical protein